MAQKTKTNKTARGMWFPFPLFLCAAFLFLAIVFVSLVWWGKYNAVSACTPSTLQLTAGQASGAAGTIYQNMDIKNTGSNSCTVAGYPTAFLYGSDGYALGNGAAASPQPAPESITLASGETAHTTLGFPQAGNFDPGICSNNKSTTLKLYMPGATTSLDVPLAYNWCPGFSSRALQAGS